jgi:signal transduction histidine kinase
LAAALTVAALSLGMRNVAALGSGYHDLYLADIWVGLLFPVVGAWLLSRNRAHQGHEHRVGWLLVSTGLLALCGFCGQSATLLLATGAQQDVAGPAAALIAAWVATWAWVPYLFLTTLLPQLWPTGRVVHGILTPVTVVALGAVTAAAAVLPGPLEGFPRIENPLGGPPWVGELTGILIGGVVLLLAPLSMLAAWRRLRREATDSDIRKRQAPLIAACGLAAFAVLTQDSFTYPLSDIWPALAFTGVAAAVVVPTARADRRTAAEREQVRLARVIRAERERIHRDLHDELGPELAGMALQVAAAADRLRDAESRESLEALAQRMRLSVGEVRRIVESVRPAALEADGLPAALERRAAELSTGPTHIDLVHDALEALPPHLEETLYRVVSEAMSNAVRHSGAGHCRVTVTVGPREVIAEIADDGHGISGTSTGTGIPGMRDRVARAGGTLIVGPGTAVGTTVRVRIPLEEGA